MTSSPIIYNGRVYVGVSSGEEVQSANPSYACCTFRGQAVAVDLETGAVAWRYYTVPEPRRTGVSANGTPQYGPSGAAVWSSPVVDPTSDTVYFATGNNYTGLKGDGDSVIALGATTGAVRWRQRRDNSADLHRVPAPVDRDVCGTDPKHGDAPFDKCLALWRGDPLADVVPGPRLAVEITRLEGSRLESSRLSLTDWRIECSLMLGQHHDMLGELAGLSMQYPLHETLHGQYMLALCRAGRRSQALDVFQRLRLGLHAELGLEPSPVLQRLQRAVLSADPALEGERTTLETFRAAMAC